MLIQWLITCMNAVYSHCCKEADWPNTQSIHVFTVVQMSSVILSTAKHQCDCLDVTSWKGGVMHTCAAVDWAVAFVTLAVFPPLLWSAAFVPRALCFAQSAFRLLALRFGLLEFNTKNMYSEAAQLCALKSLAIAENARSEKNMQYACKLSNAPLNF